MSEPNQEVSLIYVLRDLFKSSLEIKIQEPPVTERYAMPSGIDLETFIYWRNKAMTFTDLGDKR